MRTFFFSALLLATTFTSFSQCQYDFNGDGFADMADSDLLFQLSQYGIEDSPADHNGNGVCDLLDVMQYVRHAGQNCPIDEVPETTGLISELILAEHMVHTDGLSSDFGTIPPGWITYRLYAVVDNPDVRLIGYYGDETHPAHFATSAPMFQSEFGGMTTTQVNPLFYTIDNTLAFDSWFACGLSPEEDDGPTFYNLFDTGSTGEFSWEDSLATQLGFVWDDYVSAGFSHAVAYDIGESENPELRVMGQFTVAPDVSIDGLFNVQVVQLNPSGSFGITAYQTLTNLTFSTDNLTEFGCTDPDAENYSPGASIDDGSCTYFGDFDGDGMISTSDILELIGNFGCTTCDDLDLDGDGIIGVGDLLLVLGIFGSL